MAIHFFDNGGIGTNYLSDTRDPHYDPTYMKESSISKDVIVQEASTTGLLICRYSDTKEKENKEKADAKGYPILNRLDTTNTGEKDPVLEEIKEAKVINEKLFYRFSNRFLLWEDSVFLYKYREIMSHIATYMDTMKLKTCLLKLKNYDRLANFPIWAMQFSPDKFLDIEDFIVSKNDTINLIFYWDSGMFNNPEGEILLNNLKAKYKSFADKTFLSDTEFEMLLSTDENTRKKGIKILDAKLLNIRNDYRTSYVASMSSYTDSFNYKSIGRAKILEDLKKSDLLVFLNKMNDAVFNGISVDDLRYLLTDKMAGQSQILPMKFFQIAFANYKRIFALENASSDVNSAITELTSSIPYNLTKEELEDKIKKADSSIKILEQSPYCLWVMLTDVVRESLSTIRKLPGLTFGILDCSGSNASAIESNIPISGIEIGILSAYQNILMCENFAFSLTSGRFHNNEAICIHAQVSFDPKDSIIAFFIKTLIQYSHGTRSSGIYCQKQLHILSALKEGKVEAKGVYKDIKLSSTKGLISLTTTPIQNLIVYSDSEDCDNYYNLYPATEAIMVANFQHVVNVRNSAGKFISNSEQWMTDIGGYSDYYLEYIYSCNNISAPFEKGNSTTGIPFRIFL